MFFAVDVETPERQLARAVEDVVDAAIDDVGADVGAVA